MVGEKAQKERNPIHSLMPIGFWYRVWIYEEALSPVNRDCKFRDRPSPLGPLGKPQSVECEELNARGQEQQSATELLSLGSRPPVEVASVEEGEEVDQMAGSPSVQSRSPVTAPLVYASMLDFRVSMESNPQILGEDWPTQLEKISLHGFEGYAPLASLQTFLVCGAVFLLGILLILTLVRAKDRKWTEFDTEVPAAPSYTGRQGQLGCARTTTKKLPMRLYYFRCLGWIVFLDELKSQERLLCHRKMRLRCPSLHDSATWLLQCRKGEAESLLIFTCLIHKTKLAETAKNQQTNRPLRKCTWERCLGTRVLGFGSLKKHFNDVGFASKFQGTPFPLPLAREDHLLIETASLGTVQVLWAHLVSPKAWHPRILTFAIHIQNAGDLVSNLDVNFWILNPVIHRKVLNHLPMVGEN
ncbi:LOW QUALITY PROTEIN: hypothetical protein NC652_023526 [Populus alba x Populus x berolinensis]|nr:LOW QUALITY PROTEIN: hypothetical protein NC652_023526 [Populus alba x Populus x berolinensis]